MAWSDVKSQLVTMLEGVTPSTTVRGLPAKFTHEPQVFSATDARGFTIRIRAMRGVGPLMPSAQTLRSTYSLTLTVFYPLDLEPEEQDTAIQSDYLDLREALLDDSGWNRPTSTIEMIFAGFSESLLPATIERDETGARMLIDFDLEFRG